MAHMKKCSYLLILREMQMRLYLDTMFSSIKLSKIESGMNVNWYNLYAGQLAMSITLQMHMPFDPSVYFYEYAIWSCELIYEGYCLPH